MSIETLSDLHTNQLPIFSVWQSNRNTPGQNTAARGVQLLLFKFFPVLWRISHSQIRPGFPDLFQKLPGLLHTFKLEYLFPSLLIQYDNPSNLSIETAAAHFCLYVLLLQVNPYQTGNRKPEAYGDVKTFDTGSAPPPLLLSPYFSSSPLFIITTGIKRINPFFSLAVLPCRW